MDFTDTNNIGQSYKNFILLSIDDLPDYKSKGIYLRHKTTGLEVYHILTEDKENLFAFAFRTVAKDNMGTAHIMEHSTLCGSEKYPLKEPFNTLASTSLSTFLNALTYPDKTVYPAASVVKADYFNMLDVYADSVFFPKLDYQTFIQEGHRLEMDEDGKLSIQGVVYNEMKGIFSSFNQVAYSQLVSAMFPNSYPSFESGGDPKDIPLLTYEQFLEFHQKFYNPDNCLLFLYGDIPTAEQLDYFDENFISRIEKKYNCNQEIPYAYSKLPFIKDEIKQLQELKLHSESEAFRLYAPETGATGNLVTMNWYSGTANMEKYYLSEVLCGNDSSPLIKALTESGLGDEPSCGNFGQFKQEFFSLGLGGVKKQNEEKIYKLLEETLNQVYETGVSQDEVDSAIMGIDFNLREVNRYFGPPSIQIMEKALKGWSRGDSCSSMLSPISSFEKVKNQLASDPDFTKKLIKKYFYTNPVIIKCVVEPSGKFFKERETLEKQLIKKLEKNSHKEKLKAELDSLHAYQQKIETPEETACIPSTKLSELDSKIDFPKTDVEFFNSNGDYKVPVFISKENTNGIFYVDVLFPFDNLDPKYFQNVSLLSTVLTNLGWNNKNWDDCITECGCIMGDIWGKLQTGFIDEGDAFQKVVNEYSKYNFMGRWWLGVTAKALTSMSKQSFTMLAEIINKMDFKDEKRFEQMLSELIAEKKSSLVSGGLDLISKRAKATVNKSCALSEMLNGITQLNTIADYKKQDTKQTLQTFENIYKECLSNGGIVHVTADEDSLKEILPLVQQLIKDIDIKELVPAKNITLEELLPYIYDNQNLTGNNCEQNVKIESQTGYAVSVSKASNVLTKEASAEMIFSEWFKNHIMWDKIRTTGGAYGASAYVDPSSRIFVMSSYRDPNPINSVKVFKESLKEAMKIEISDEDIEKTIVSIYGELIVPQTAKERGSKSFSDLIYGITPEIRKQKLDTFLSIKPEDIPDAIKRLYEGTETMYRTGIFCDKKNKTYGKIINLPL